MNELFRLGPRCFSNRLNEKINEHAGDDQRRNPPRRPVGDFDVRDPMGEHNRKKNQNQNAAYVNEQLHRRHKIGAEKHIKPRGTRDGPEKRKRGIDDVARKRDHKRRTHRDQSDQIKNCRREIHSSFNFRVLESQRLFGSNTGRSIWDQEVLRIITGLAPLLLPTPPRRLPLRPAWRIHPNTSARYRLSLPAWDPFHHPSWAYRAVAAELQNDAPTPPDCNSRLRIPGSAG